MIAGEGRTIYVSGDTDVMADMGVFEDLHHPEIGILCAGGHFTWTWSGPPMRRSGSSTSDGDPLPLPDLPAARAVGGSSAELPGVRVIEPQVLEAIEL